MILGKDGMMKEPCWKMMSLTHGEGHTIIVAAPRPGNTMMEGCMVV